MQDALGAADGAGDDVGEERNECSMIEEAARKDQLLIAIYQIHDLREGKETDAERKGEVRHEKLMVGKVGNITDEEIEIFENTEKADVQHETRLQELLSLIHI